MQRLKADTQWADKGGGGGAGRGRREGELRLNDAGARLYRRHGPMPEGRLSSPDEATNLNLKHTVSQGSDKREPRSVPISQKKKKRHRNRSVLKTHRTVRYGSGRPDFP